MSSRWHEDYERGRPGYPPECVRVVDLPESAVVLEPGAGTGKLTRRLVECFARVVAVEPDPGMRAWHARVCPRSELLAAMAEQLPFADAAFDAAYIAEAFHWFDHDNALTEIARVLRPGAPLVLLWNRPAGPVEPAITEVEALLEPEWPKEIAMPLDLDPSRFPYANEWQSAFGASRFEPLRATTVPNRCVVDRDELVAFFGSMGWINARSDGALTALLGEVRSRLTGDEYTLPFETLVYWTRRAT